MVYSSGNTTLKASTIQLPTTPLLHPIAVYTDSSLIIIPRDQSNTLYSLSPISQTALNDPNSTTEFQSIATTQPGLWNKPISCLHADSYGRIYFIPCYSTVDHHLFILQSSLTETEGPRQTGISNINRTFEIILLTYDLQNNLYSSSSSFRVNFDGYTPVSSDSFRVYHYFHFLPTCVYTVWYGNRNPKFKIVMMASYVVEPDSGSSGMVFADSTSLLGHVYYDIDGTWETVEWGGFSAARGGVACAHMDGIGQVYLFGGVLHDRELRYGEKCAADPTDGDCEYLNELMQYSRSNFHVSRIYGSGTYLLIVGGTSEEAQNHIEVFDTKRDRFITPGALRIGSLNRDTFTPFMLSDVILTIVGGINTETNESVEAVEYMDLSQLLDYELDLSPCITTYTECTSIDEYLLDSVEHLAFEVYNIDEGTFTLDVAATNVDFVFGYRFEPQSDNILRISVEYYGGVVTLHRVDIDLDELSMDTNINMTNGHYVLWIQFGLGLGFRDVIGFGHILGENSIWKYCVFPPCEPDQLPDDPVLSLYEIRVCDAAFTFRMDSCSLQLQITEIDSFVIGDYVQVIANWSITDATSLNYPISIASDDIRDFDYVMTIRDNATTTSICTVCRVSDINDCIGCDEGIQMINLQTKSIHNNSYKISITSDYQHTNPQESVIILQRMVQEIQFEIYTPSNHIYPGSAIFIIPNYNQRNDTEPLQPNGRFMIEFDDHLSFTDNLGVLLVDFYNDVCTLTYNEKSIDCDEDAILVPWSMTFKDITANAYTLRVTSLDTNIIGPYAYEFSRQIQRISVDVSDAIYLGQNIAIWITIAEDRMVQKTSSVIISNDAYNVYSIIRIEYDVNTTQIKSCIIDSPNMDVTTTCDQGIPFKASTTEIVNHFINLTITSADTYIADESMSVLIKECHIGDALFGSADTSFICLPCGIGSVALTTGSQCFECDETDGIQCMGLSHLIVSYNYWVKITDDGSIISNFCPSGLCCGNIDGCNYTDASMLCAEGRDSSAPLCGKCMDGYSEVFGSASCAPCDDDNYSLLFIPLALAFIGVVVLLIFDPPPKPPNYTEINYVTQLSVDDFKAMQLCLLRPLLYYYQALSFVTIQNGLFFYLSPLVQLLSLDFWESITGDEEGSGVCFVSNLTSLNKELLYLFFPFCMFIAIALFALTQFCVQSVCKCKPHSRFMKHICGKLNPGTNGVMTIFIILVGNIISTMLKILACSSVDGEFVHFYSGDEACFGGFWWVALASVSAITIFWICVWFKLLRTDADERASRSATLRAVTKHYKRREWYWEFVLLSRRIIISVMVTIQYFDYHVIQYMLLTILVVYGFAHCLYYPFRYDRANTMETLCLFLLFTALSTTIFEFHLTHPTYISIVMSIIVSLPFVLLFVYLMLAIRNFCKLKSEGNVLNKSEYKERIKKWKHRLSPSQQTVYEETINGSKQELDSTVESPEIEIETVQHKKLGSDVVDGTTVGEVPYELDTQAPAVIRMKPGTSMDDRLDVLSDSSLDENSKATHSKAKKKKRSNSSASPKSTNGKAKKKKRSNSTASKGKAKKKKRPNTTASKGKAKKKKRSNSTASPNSNSKNKQSSNKKKNNKPDKSVHS